MDVQIPLHDPVKPDEPAIDFRVELILDADGFPLEYRLSLFTGVCLDGQCNPLQADLFWDVLGNYTRLEDDDAPLTKGDHKPFTDADYVRLDQILKANLSVEASVLVVAIYNVTYALPFLLVPVAVAILGERSKPILERINNVLISMVDKLMPIMLFLIGAALTADALAFLITGKSLW